MKIRKLLMSVFPVLLCFALLLGSSSFAIDREDTEIGLKMAPLQERLAGLTEKDIDESVGQYTDLKSHFARTQIAKLTAIEVLAGMGGNCYKPNDPLQADHLIKMIICAMGFKPGVGKTYWAQTYIDAAKKYGLVKAGEIKEFNKPIIRELAARILTRADSLINVLPDSKYEDYIIGKLKDYQKISDLLKQPVLDACKTGLMTGNNNVFNPKGNLTRGEAAVLVLRFLDAKERKPMKPGPGEVLKIKTNIGEWIELYPGKVPEAFVVAKAAQDYISKTKGYVTIGYNPEKSVVFSVFYESKEAWEVDCINSIGTIQIDICHNNKYLFTLGVEDINKYRIMFADYVREVIKTMYTTPKGKEKAISLHDRFLNAKYIRTDGLNDYTETTIDNRLSLFLRYNEAQFGMQLKLVGEK